jgi:hypothetical protein
MRGWTCDAENCVLTVASVEANHFITSQWDHLWAYVLDNAGSVNDRNKPAE